MPLLLSFCLAAVSAQMQFPLITSIGFDGNRSMSAQQLKRMMLTSLEGRAYVAGNLDADLRRIEQAYRDEGFLEAKVGPPEVNLQTAGNGKIAAIRIPVVEGARFALKEAAIRNVQVLPASSLMQMSPLQKGQPYSRVRIAQWQAKIEEAYRSMGYLRAHCNAQETLHEADSTVDCVLDCEEGKLYSVGKINVIGDASIDRLQFKRRILVSEGGVFNPDNLALSIQFLNEMRLYKPISYSDVEIAIDDAKGTVNLTWHLSLADR